jgi:hypothetical protein
MSSPLPDTLAQMLRDEGYRPSVEGADVGFKAEGQPFELQTFDTDDGYARLVLGYAFPSDGNVERGLRIANARNAAAKAVKTTLYPERDCVLFTVEQFFDDPARLRPILERGISALRRTSNEFFTELNTPEPVVPKARRARRNRTRTQDEPAT